MVGTNCLKNSIQKRQPRLEEFLILFHGHQCNFPKELGMSHRNTFEPHMTLLGGRIRAPRCQALSNA